MKIRLAMPATAPSPAYVHPRQAFIDKALRRAVVDFGPEVLENPQRARALLADLLPGLGWEVEVLAAALRLGIIARLHGGPRLSPILLSREVEVLYERGGMDRERARWAGLCWARALGLEPPIPAFPRLRRVLRIAVPAMGRLISRFGHLLASLPWRRLAPGPRLRRFLLCASLSAGAWALSVGGAILSVHVLVERVARALDHGIPPTPLVLTQDCRLRVEANTGSEVLVFLPQATSLTATALRDGWYRVGYEGREGWVGPACLK